MILLKVQKIQKKKIKLWKCEANGAKIFLFLLLFLKLENRVWEWSQKMS